MQADDYVERAAREKLGLIKPGEILPIPMRWRQVLTIRLDVAKRPVLAVLQPGATDRFH